MDKVNLPPVLGISKVFNEAAGDFVITSSDNVKLFIPKGVLQFSSLVFQNMFEIGRPTNDSSDAIHMSAKAEILEILFTFAHPGMPSSPVRNAATLAELFRVARQYEMDGVAETLRKVFLETPLNEKGEIGVPMYKREPMLCLVIAYQFEYTLEARLTLREVIQHDLEEGMKSVQGFDVPAELVQIICATRRERMDWLWEKLWELFTTRATKAGPYHFQPASSERQHAFMKKAVKSLKESPSFATLKRLIHGTDSSAVELRVLENSCVEVLKGWESKAMEMEEKLPSLKL